MVYRSDFVLKSADGGPIALVEVKNREGLTSQLATSIRRNLIAHGVQPVRYFVLLSQDQGFVWKELSRRLALSSSPTIEFPMGDVVARYLPKEQQIGRLRDVQMQLIVGHWLDDLTRSGNTGQTVAETALRSIGFLDDVKGASVLSEALV